MPTKLCLKSDLRPSIGQGIDSTVAPVNVVTEHIKKVTGICSEIDLLIYIFLYQLLPEPKSGLFFYI